MMVKPMKTLELHYPMIQFLIKADKPRGILVENEKNLQATRLRLVVYEFFEYFINIPSGLSAYIP